MFRKSTLAASAATFSLCTALLPAGVSAQTLSAQEAAELFGARQTVRQVSLSPDGTKLAYISPMGAEGEVLYTVDLTAAVPAPKRAVGLNMPRSNLDFCEWATNERLVCRTSKSQDGVGSERQIFGFSRIFAVDADGQNVEQLSQQDNMRTIYVAFSGGSLVALDPEGEPDKILMTRYFSPEDGANTRLANKERGLGVVEVDIDNGKASKVVSPADDVFSYMADDTGEVRLKGTMRFQSGNDSGQRNYFYRERGSSRWEPLSRAMVGAQNLEDGFIPSAIDYRTNSVYGFERNADGYLAVYRQTLDGSGTREEVVSRNDVDVDDIIRLGRKKRVVGVSYATEKREAVYFDPELDALADGLRNALPGNPLIGIRGANADESRLLISASSDTDPGMLYLYDKATRQLNELMPLRDGFAGRTLGQMQPVTYPAADGTAIPGYLTLPPGKENAQGLPAIVMPHGGPSSRDEWGFDWLVQFFAARGYAVLQPNFRGSAGYGEAWFGKNGFQQWETAIGDVNDAGRWLVSEGIADPAKLAIVGWSYGGYAALQSQVLDPALYKAVAAIAPVADLNMLRNEFRSYSSFRLMSDFIGEGPHVTAGSPVQNASRFASPVILFHGTTDQNVSVAHAREMEDALQKAGKPVQYIEFEDSAHSIDNSAHRVQMLTAIDRFLTQSLGQ